MENFIDYILTAFALIFVIEGMLYAVFPDAMKRGIAMLLSMPSSSVRRFGFGMVLCGFGMVALMRVIGL